MRNKPQFHALETVKTLLIVLLAVSAGYLLSRTSLQGKTQGLLSSLGALLPSAATTEPSGAEEAGGLVRPARLVVMNDKPGRYGIQYDQENLDAKFGGTLLNLISDALSDASAPKSVGAQAWLSALGASERAGFYLEFPSAVPCADLAIWLGGRASNAKLSGEVRRLLLTEDGAGKVTLYYSDEGEGAYYACDTSSALTERLRAAVSGFEPNGAQFAMDDSAQYGALAPETLILPQLVQPRVYTVSNPIPSGSDAVRAVIQALSFRPPSGPMDTDDLPIREGADTLRIGGGGVVSYYSASEENPRFPVGQGGTASNREMVAAAWKLVDACMGDLTGAARLYLAGLRTEGSGVVAYFGYQLDGIVVQVGQEGYAARVAMEEGRISAFTLQLRRYDDGGATSIVLPELQAAAAMEALDVAGSELMLCYSDQGGEIRAIWVAAS